MNEYSLWGKEIQSVFGDEEGGRHNHHCDSHGINVPFTHARRGRQIIFPAFPQLRRSCNATGGTQVPLLPLEISGLRVNIE